MAHQHRDIFENRKEFQLERMILFSDAVFAIAITLLVIDIRLPEGNLSSRVEVINMVMEKLPQLIGFAVSFFVIGQFWVSHHRLFSFVTSYDSGLLWLNLHLLFWIALVPFSTGFNFRYGNLDFTWSWYSINMFLIAIALYLIWVYISNPRRNLTFLLDDPRRLKYGRIRSLSIAIIFLLGFALCLFQTLWMSYAARFVFFLIFPAMRFISYRYNRNLPKQITEVPESSAV